MRCAAHLPRLWRGSPCRGPAARAAAGAGGRRRMAAGGSHSAASSRGGRETGAPSGAGACGNWVPALSLPLVARAPAPEHCTRERSQQKPSRCPFLADVRQRNGTAISARLDPTRSKAFGYGRWEARWYNTPQPHIWMYRMWGHGTAGAFFTGPASRSLVVSSFFVRFLRGGYAVSSRTPRNNQQVWEEYSLLV